MNWRLVAQLSLFGAAMGVASVFLIPPAVEPFVWLAIFVVCAAIIARKCARKHFLHGFLVSVANSVWMTAGHIVFFDDYIARHPREAAMAAQMGSPRLMMLATGPVVALISGLVLGLLAFGASKVLEPAAG
jgi:hypothetical protein